MLQHHVAFYLPRSQERMVVAEVLDFPGVFSQGFDLADARAMIASALEDIAESYLEEGCPLDLHESCKWQEGRGPVEAGAWCGILESLGQTDGLLDPCKHGTGNLSEATKQAGLVHDTKLVAQQNRILGQASLAGG